MVLLLRICSPCRSLRHTVKTIFLIVSVEYFARNRCGAVSTITAFGHDNGDRKLRFIQGSESNKYGVIDFLAPDDLCGRTGFSCKLVREIRKALYADVLHPFDYRIPIRLGEFALIQHDLFIEFFYQLPFVGFNPVYKQRLQPLSARSQRRCILCQLKRRVFFILAPGGKNHTLLRAFSCVCFILA